MALYTPRTTEHVYLNDQDITKICIGYTPNEGALVFIFMPNGKRLKTTKGIDYHTFIYGKLEVKPMPY